MMTEYFTTEQIDNLEIHFILCTERTGSTLLCSMLNQSERVLATSEEPFAVYFYSRYHKKVRWSEEEINRFVEEFWLMAEKSLGLYFTSRENLRRSLLLLRENLNYQRLMKVVYLHFIEPKPKSKVSHIIDKQIKYLFYLPLLVSIFPDAKFLVLTRDVRDNVISKSNRQLNAGQNAIYLAAVWKYSYENVLFLESAGKSVLVLHYEEMVRETEKALREVSSFFGFPFDPAMLATEGKYRQFLESRREFVEPQFLAQLEDFHSGLFQAANTSKINQKSEGVDSLAERKILRMNKELYNYFRYPVQTTEATYTLSDYLQIFRAWLYRPFLLRAYLHIPFTLKLLIKRVRKKNVRA